MRQRWRFGPKAGLVGDTYLPVQHLVAHEGNLEIGAYQLPPQVVPAAAGPHALPYEVHLTHHDLACDKEAIRVIM